MASNASFHCKNRKLTQPKAGSQLPGFAALQTPRGSLKKRVVTHMSMPLVWTAQGSRMPGCFPLPGDSLSQRVQGANASPPTPSSHLRRKRLQNKFDESCRACKKKCTGTRCFTDVLEDEKKLEISRPLASQALKIKKKT